MISIIGAIAGTLTTGSCLPQIIKIIRTDSTGDLSLLTYSMITLGCTLWIIYGILLQSTPLIACNLISLVLTSVILFKIIRGRYNGRKRRKGNLSKTS